MAKESAAKPFYSVLVLAFFCSLLVAGAAVGLKPQQLKNRALDQKKNILLAAGLYDPAIPIEDRFSTIEPRIIELATGEFVEKDTLSTSDYNQLKAAMSEDMGRSLSKDEDIAGIRRLEKYSLVYLAGKDDKISQIILPIRGKGLWSTLYGYLALEGDLSTVTGISFYQHGETPGLGGEIENPSWLAGWKGKKVYDQEQKQAIWIGKQKGQLDTIHQVDGISGATLTINGVNDIMTFWFGEHGFKPFLQQMKMMEANNG